MSTVLLKDFGCTPLAVLGGCENNHIDVAVPINGRRGSGYPAPAGEVGF